MAIDPLFAKWGASKALDFAFNKAKQFLADTATNLTSTKQDVESIIAYQLGGVQRWCEEISFKDLREARSTVNVYVGLSVYILPRSIRLEQDEPLEKQTVTEVLKGSSDHLIILGQPGAGKSTSMKYICHQLMHDETFLPDGPSFPLVVRLRDLNPSIQKRQREDIFGDRIIIPAIARHLGLTFRLGKTKASHEDKEEASDLASSIVLLFLDELKPLLVLDGFDELATRELRDSAMNEIRSLTRQLSKARVLLTSRTGEFPYQIENSSIFEICPLTKSQIHEFATKWLVDNDKVQHFLKEIEQSPFADTTIKPLTLAHLCAIYDRLGRIPDKPKTVYRKVVNLLIDEWDEQRSVTRHSRYAGFSSDRKFDFLCRLAYELTLTERGSVFLLDDLRKIYGKLCNDFDLLSNESKQVLSELESHTGLFVQAGYQAYEFVHRSLQEYLTAEYIKGLPSLLTTPKVIARMPNELAIAVAISTNPSRYLSELVMLRLQKMVLPPEFFTAFVNRLIQEKPEFNAEEEVMLALFVLYTLYLGGAPALGQQWQLFVFDDLANQFERLLTVLAKRNKRRTILEYYVRDGDRYFGEQTPVLVFKKKRELDSLELPEILYARAKFFQSLADLSPDRLKLLGDFDA
jgi:hypothetical protein